MTTEYPKDPSQFTAKYIRGISTAMLPSVVRQISDSCAELKHDWWIAWQNYQDRYRALTLYHHRDEGFQISAARDKAAIDPEIQESSIHSSELREQLELLQRIQKNLEQELEVRLAFLKRMELPSIEQPQKR